MYQMPEGPPGCQGDRALALSADNLMRGPRLAGHGKARVAHCAGLAQACELGERRVVKLARTGSRDAPLKSPHPHAGRRPAGTRSAWPHLAVPGESS
jgi:hypothetical protein